MRLKQYSKFDLSKHILRLEKKFKNATKEMTAKHNLSIVQLDHDFEKSVSNRPRYQPESSKKISMADKSMRSTFSRKDLVSAKGGRRVWRMIERDVRVWGDSACQVRSSNSDSEHAVKKQQESLSHLYGHTKMTAHSATFSYSVAEWRHAVIHHGIAKFLSDYAFTLED